MTTQQQSEARSTARELLQFLEEMMNALVRVDIGDPAVAQLSLLELRVLMVLGDSAQATTWRPVPTGDAEGPPGLSAVRAAGRSVGGIPGATPGTAIGVITHG